MTESYLEIQLDQEPIELCKLLKVADLVAGGGEAKVVISEGYVLLNGEVEYQKRKKVYHNDIVEFNGDTLQIIVNENLEDELTPEKVVPAGQTKSIESVNEKHKVENAQEKVAPRKSKRKPISF